MRVVLVAQDHVKQANDRHLPERAQAVHEASRGRATIHRRWRKTIRALSVSLLAVAAVAASLLLSREKPERTLSDGVAPADRGLPAEQTLDEIRAAGL